MSICRINLWLEDIQITFATNEGKQENPDLCPQSSFSFLAVPFRNTAAFLVKSPALS